VSDPTTFVPPAPLLVAEAIRAQAEGRPGTVAVDDGSHALTFAELVAAAASVARHARAVGIRLGDRVVVQSSLRSEVFSAWVGLNAVGAVLVPITPKHTEQERAWIQEDCRPVWSIGEADLERIAVPGVDMLPEPPADLSELAPALMRYSSGTTDGRLKGILLSHRSLVLTFWLEAIEFGHRPGTRLLTSLPWSGAGGFFVMSMLSVGGGAVLQRTFDTGEWWRLAESSSLTNALVVPTQAVRLVATPPEGDLCLRTVVSTGAPLADTTRERLATISGAEVIDCYGATETSVALVRRPIDGAGAGLGRNATGARVRVVDEAGAPVADGTLGQIAKRGPDVFSGYWQRPELTTRLLAGDGFIRTGDIGVRRPDGTLAVADRREDLILSGGNSIAPAEIENCLLHLDGVTEAAVVGVSDPDLGERVVAVLVTSRELSVEEVLAHCGNRLAAYKLPRQVEFRAELPVNAAGKVVRRRLRKELGDRSDGERAGS